MSLCSAVVSVVDMGERIGTVLGRWRRSRAICTYPIATFAICEGIMSFVR